MLVDDGILLHTYWLAVDQGYQEERFAERAKYRLKRWKLSPNHLEARERHADCACAIVPKREQVRCRGAIPMREGGKIRAAADGKGDHAGQNAMEPRQIACRRPSKHR